MATQPVPRLTEAEYLRIERAAQFRSEFVDGEMYAMAGGTSRHSLLELSVGAEIRALLKGKRCRAYSSNLRVRVPDGRQLYPDVSVVCGPIQYHAGATDIFTNPILVGEVLSPSTAIYDRGGKFELYRTIPSLRDYLLLHQHSIFAEHYTRNVDGSWTLREYRGEEAAIPLLNIECLLRLGNVYEGVMEEPD